MTKSGLRPIGESANAPSRQLLLHCSTSRHPWRSQARGPRLDPIGESTTGASMHRGPRLDPIGEAQDLHR
jgi:hypothetical protein